MKSSRKGDNENKGTAHAHMRRFEPIRAWGHGVPLKVGLGVRR